MKKLIAASLTFSVFLAGCSQVTNQDVGTLGGGVVGGLLGSRFGSGNGKVAAAAGGALLGAFVGGKIGQYMDRQDRMEMQRALETAPTGKAVNWTNPDNGNKYSVQSNRTYYVNDQPCREYVTHAVIGGRNQQIYGKACRQTDGTWQVSN